MWDSFRSLLGRPITVDAPCLHLAIARFGRWGWGGINTCRVCDVCFFNIAMFSNSSARWWQRWRGRPVLPVEEHQCHHHVVQGKVQWAAHQEQTPVLAVWHRRFLPEHKLGVAHQCPAGTRYPTRTRNFFQYPIHTIFSESLGISGIGYFRN